MELIDNISRLLGDDLKHTIRPGARLKIAASCFELPRNCLNIGGTKKVSDADSVSDTARPRPDAGQLDLNELAGQALGLDPNVDR